MNNVLRWFGAPIFAARVAASLASYFGSAAPPATVGRKADGLVISDASRQFSKIEAAGASHGILGSTLLGPAGVSVSSLGRHRNIYSDEQRGIRQRRPFYEIPPVRSVQANVDAVLLAGGEVVVNSFNGIRTMHAIKSAQARRTGVGEC